MDLNDHRSKLGKLALIKFVKLIITVNKLFTLGYQN